MTIGDARELERLRWGESVNRRLRLRDAKQSEIDRTINQRSGAWHAARAELAFDFIAEEIEDRIAIRKEIIARCPELASKRETQQFERELSSGIEDQIGRAHV